MTPRDEDVDVVEDMMLGRDMRASLLRKDLKIRLHYFHTTSSNLKFTSRQSLNTMAKHQLHRCSASQRLDR